MISKIIKHMSWWRGTGHKQPILSTPLEVYKALRIKMMKESARGATIYLCQLLDSLKLSHSITLSAEMVVRQRFMDAIRASGGTKAIWLPRVVSTWLIETDNLFTDIDEGCRESIRLGVLDQLIADEEAKPAPSKG